MFVSNISGLQILLHVVIMLLTQTFSLLHQGSWYSFPLKNSRQHELSPKMAKVANQALCLGAFPLQH